MNILTAQDIYLYAKNVVYLLKNGYKMKLPSINLNMMGNQVEMNLITTTIVMTKIKIKDLLTEVFFAIFRA
jgi:hypothetical protein